MCTDVADVLRMRPAMNSKELRPSSAIYRLDREAGRGQSASVFRAVREDSEGHSRQIVALKILKDKRTVHWLRREFETLAQINSPHCAKVLAWENLADGPALALEWIDGVRLVDLARSEDLHFRIIDEIIAQIQEGLRAIEKAGLHHGDLSPANVLIDKSGCVKLVDFATAPALPGVIHGTPAYIAPEIWSGSSTSLDADLFALGLIEHDLRTKFLHQPVDIEECKLRSSNLAVECPNQLLSRKPRERSPRPFISREEVRVELANRVRAHLDRRTLLLTETRPLTMPKPRRSFAIKLPIRMALSFATVLFTTALSVRAQAPLPQGPQDRASIHIRSQKWVRIWLNGRDLGYAPIDVSRLLPGSHRLTWQTASGKGERRIQLTSGSTTLLNESDLSRLEE